MPKLGNNLEFAKNQALNMKLQNLTTDPVGLTAADEGLIWTNTTANTVMYWNGTAAIKLTNMLQQVAAVAPVTATAIDGSFMQTIDINNATTVLDGAMAAADKLKLDGVATAATANSTDAVLKDLANATGTLAYGKGGTGGVAVPTAWGAPYGTGSALAYTAAATTNQVLTGTTGAAPAYKTFNADWAIDGTTNHVFTAADDTKLGGIATGATANATDAVLKDRAQATGTQLHTTISDFDAGVAANPVSSLLPATADVDMNSWRIVGLSLPINTGDAAPKGYVDSVVSGLDVKKSVAVASVANIVGTYAPATNVTGLFTLMPNLIDGVTLVDEDRILLKNQTVPAQNGVWKVNSAGTGANGQWQRASDFDGLASSGGLTTSGAFCFVEKGTTNGATGWVLSTPNPFTIGTASGSNLAFTQFSGAGTYAAGAGLTLAGGSFAVGGTAARIVVNADTVDIDPGYVGQNTITTVSSTTGVTTGVWAATDVAVAHGGTGASTAAVARTNLGLGSVDNTADVDKPASTAQLSSDNLRLLKTSNLMDIPDSYAARANLGAAGKVALLVGSGGSGGLGGVANPTIVHNLNTEDVIVGVYEVGSKADVLCDITRLNVNSIRLDFSVAPVASTLRCTVMG